MQKKREMKKVKPKKRKVNGMKLKKMSKDYVQSVENWQKMILEYGQDVSKDFIEYRIKRDMEHLRNCDAKLFKLKS